MKKKRRKKISFFKKTNRIKYFYYMGTYFYSKFSNKSKYFVSYIIKVKNDSYFEILDIFLDKEEIFLKIKNNNLEKIINISYIECQCVFIPPNIISRIEEPISLF